MSTKLSTQLVARPGTVTGMCPDCATHEAQLCALCHTAIGCRAGLAGHACLAAADD